MSEPLIYAVGDVHGRADLLAMLIARIGADRGERDAPTPLVFLGDYVDRGVQSRETIDLLLGVAGDPRFAPRFLKGNHEASMLDFLARPETGAAWLSYGGGETLYSYGVRAPAASAEGPHLQRAAEALRANLPAAHLEFLSNLELTARYDDYVFVHAGLRPGRALEAQDEQDLLTIRDPFLKNKRPFPFVVVHGHTPSADVYIDRRRICVDTGAYVTGKLSAVRLAGDDVKVLST